jgi:hypothetical protein
MRENESPTRTEENEVHTQKNNVKNNKNAKSKQGIPTKGMRVGYHSEAANIGAETEKTDGMRVGYHSESANPSGHSRRLHRKGKNKK